MPVAAIYSAWAKAPAASSSFHATGATPNCRRAALCAFRTTLRSRSGPRSAGAGQCGFGRLAAEHGVATRRAIRTQRIMTASLAVQTVKDVSTCVPQRDDLALYVHWPFCVSKCPYCDFNSHVRDNIDQEAWRDALLADLAHEARLLPDKRLTSIFFGGGTPSLMEPATAAAIIEAAFGHHVGKSTWVGNGPFVALPANH